MKKIKLLIAVFFTMLLTSGCASSYPMGLNEEQWNSLSKEKQIELTIEQNRLNQERSLLEEKRQLQQGESSSYQQQAQTLPFRYGDIATVSFYSGIGKFGKREKNILPQSFMINRGETKEIQLRMQYKDKKYTETETIFLVYAQDGSKIEIFGETPNQRRQRITLLNDGKWNRGIKYSNQNAESSKYIALRNVSVGVRFYDEESRYDDRNYHHKDYRNYK